MILDTTQLALLRVILEEHDGDDRCHCLAHALYAACSGQAEAALEIALACRDTHTTTPWGKA